MGVCKTKRSPEPVGVTYVRHLSEIAIGIIAVAALAMSPCSFSQSNNASMEGENTDPAGSVVPEAKVTLQSKDPKTVSTLYRKPTDSKVFATFCPSTYQQKVTALDFGDYVQDDQACCIS
jgi:hypothetical protein